jgi:hypothetical protein
VHDTGFGCDVEFEGQFAGGDVGGGEFVGEGERGGVGGSVDLGFVYEDVRGVLKTSKNTIKIVIKIE